MQILFKNYFHSKTTNYLVSFRLKTHAHNVFNYFQNALNLSAPASGVLLENRSSNWFQLSGHPDCLAPAGPGTVWKKRSGGPDDTERIVYEELSEDALIKDIIPKYYREVDYQGEKFIELQDLLHGFQVRIKHCF